MTSGLTITNVPVANASLVAADSHVSSISVIGANTTDLDSATLGNLANVTSIALASGATSLTYAEYHNANSKLISTGLTITGVSVANAATLNADNHVSSITLTGVTAANLDTNSLGNLSKVTSIALASGVTNLSYTEYVDANGKLVTNGLTITGVSIANSSDVLTDTKVSGLSISDNAANISANLDVLETEVGKISGISVSDSTIVTITPAQKTSDAAILALITAGGGSFKVVGSIPTSGTVDIFLANEASLGASSFTINDTAANISSHLNAIENGINTIAGINLTNSTPPSIVLSAQQFLADQDVLVTMAANQTLGHPAYILSLAAGETLTAEQAASINQTIFENFIANSVVVKDSAANIEKYAAQLQNLTIDPPLGAIQLTDTSAVILNLPQNDSSLFNILSSVNNIKIQIAVTGVAAADVKSLLQNPLIGQLNISDTAANIQHYWADIESSFKFTASALTAVPSGVVNPYSYIWGMGLPSFFKAIPAGIQTVAVGYDGKVGTYTTTGSEGYQLFITPKSMNGWTGLSPADNVLIQSLQNAATSVDFKAALAAIENPNSDINVTLGTYVNFSVTGGMDNGSALFSLPTQSNEISSIHITDNAVLTLNYDRNGFDPMVLDALNVISGTSQVVLQITEWDPAHNTALFNDLATSTVPITLQFDNLYTLNNSYYTNELLALDKAMTANPLLNVSFTSNYWYIDGNTDFQALSAMSNVNLLKQLGALNISYSPQPKSTDVNGFLSFFDANSKFYQYVIAPHNFAQPINGIVDSAANIQSHLDQLAVFKTQLVNTSISFTDTLPPTLTVTAAQVVNDFAVLNAIHGNYLLSVKGSANALNDLDLHSGLNTLSATYIELIPTDLNEVLTIRANVKDLDLTQLGLSAQAVITVLTTAHGGTEVDITDGAHSYQIILASTPPANLTIFDPVDAGSSLQSFTVSSIEFVQQLTHFEDLLKAGKLGTITLSDAVNGTVPVITLAEDQFVLDNSVLKNISSAFSVSVSGVAAADVKSLLQNPLIGQLNISDTAANIQHYWADIESSFKISDSALTALPSGLLNNGYFNNQSAVWIQSGFIKSIPAGIQTVAVGYDGKVGTYTTTGSEGYQLFITPKSMNGWTGLSPADNVLIQSLQNAATSVDFKAALAAIENPNSDINVTLGTYVNFSVTGGMDNGYALFSMPTQSSAIASIHVTDNSVLTLNYDQNGFDPMVLDALNSVSGASQVVLQLRSDYVGYYIALFNDLASATLTTPITLQFNGLWTYNDISYINELLALDKAMTANPSLTVSFTNTYWYIDGNTNFQALSGMTNVSLLQQLGALNISYSPQPKSTDVNGFLSFFDANSKFYQYVIAPHNFAQPINGIVDSAANIQSHLDQLAVFKTQLVNTSISFTDTLPPTLTVTAAQVTNESWLFKAIQGSYLLSVADKASALNVATFNAKNIEITPTVLDTSLTINTAVADVNLTQLGLSGNAQILETSINGGLGTQINITDGAQHYQIVLSNTLQSALVVYGPVAVTLPIQNIVTTTTDLVTHLAYYEDLFKAGKLGSLAVTDVANLSAITSAVDLIQYHDLFSLLQAPANIASAYSSYLAGTLTHPVLIDATSADIMANLSNLSVMSKAGGVSSIVVNDAVTSIHVLTVGVNGELAATNAQTLSAGGITQFDASTHSTTLDSLGLQGLLHTGITFTSDSIAVNAQINSADFSLLTNANLSALNAAGVGTIGVNLGNSASIQTLDGISGHLNFEFAQNTTGTPSETHFDSILNFNGKDEISFTSLLQVVGNTGSASDGLASINATTGIANFSANDNTLALQLAAVENAIASANTPAAGHVVVWANGGNTEVLITDSHSGSGIGAGDNLIQLVGVSPDHVALLNGVIVAV